METSKAKVLASGSDGAPSGWLKLGHFAAMRWETGAEAPMPEVFVGGEGLARGPVEVLGTLLHEAAHAMAHARGVKDTSRQGRYHNQRYADLARQLGLDVQQAKTIGWSDTSVTDVTAAEYASTIAELAQALTIYRRSRTSFASMWSPPCADQTTRSWRRRHSVTAMAPASGSTCG